MNVREKVLVLLFGVVIVAFVSRTIMRNYSEALQDYGSLKRAQEKKLEKIRAEKQEANFARMLWIEELGPQTLSMDVNEAKTKLRDELYALAGESLLREINVTLVDRTSLWPPSGKKSGVQVLRGTVTAEGYLEEIVEFFFNLQRQPYAVRCKSLMLDQIVKGSRRRKGNRETGLLKVTAHLDTLILPANQMVPQFRPAVLEKDKRKMVVRAMLANISDYKPLLDKHLFKPYEPPPPPPPRRRSEKRRPTRNVKRGPEPEPEKPPEDAHMTLRGVLSSPRGQITVLEKPGKKGGDDEYKEVGDTMFGGTLIYVHPKGAVTEKGGERRFHAIGQELQDFVPLTEENEPVIYHELLKLENRSTGISQGS